MVANQALSQLSYVPMSELYGITSELGSLTYGRCCTHSSAAANALARLGNGWTSHDGASEFGLVTVSSHWRIIVGDWLTIAARLRSVVAPIRC